ncbi:MAG TPA: isoprenylcysteine carboxylmethyltransferase family protein [Vicinamibacterales bacterium]|jgi:protein-S-isoprenylcysteine O-methyltransferase Ste14|nr:isoprenylcysteine carboxylmethyltransferase family protein [Vicinamibacterales bacterium]
MTRLGGWLFRHRTIIPLPLAIALLLLRPGDAPHSRWLVPSGVALTVLGEALRLWAVRHIGVISRTRSDRLGSLVASGPFAIVRNPLYAGNIALWTGFAIAARLLWLVPIVIVLLAIEYHAIVRWEEQLLEARLGDDYRAYAARVPRWFPTGRRGERGLRRGHGAFSWREALFSERGTLIAMAVGYAALWIQARF